MKKSVIFAVLLIVVIASVVIANYKIDFGQLKVTLEHPFLINGNWVKANELKVGDKLTTEDGRKAVISSIEKVSVPEGIEVYNLEDELFHNYISDGIVVHNSDNPKWVGELSLGAAQDRAPAIGLVDRVYTQAVGRFGGVGDGGDVPDSRVLFSVDIDPNLPTAEKPAQINTMLKESKLFFRLRTGLFLFREYIRRGYQLKLGEVFKDVLKDRCIDWNNPKEITYKERFDTQLKSLVEQGYMSPEQSIRMRADIDGELDALLGILPEDIYSWQYIDTNGKLAVEIRFDLYPNFDRFLFEKYPSFEDPIGKLKPEYEYLNDLVPERDYLKRPLDQAKIVTVRKRINSLRLSPLIENAYVTDASGRTVVSAIMNRGTIHHINIDVHWFRSVIDSNGKIIIEEKIINYHLFTKALPSP